MIIFALEHFRIRLVQDLGESHKYVYCRIKEPNEYGYFEIEELHRYGYSIVKKLDGNIYNKYSFQILINADKQI